MPDYSDEDLRGGIDDLRVALRRLTETAAAIDSQESVRARLEHELGIVAQAVDALDAIAHDASQELL